MFRTGRPLIVLILSALTLASCSWDDIMRGTYEGAKSACRYQDNCTVRDDATR